jgi:hypothetical protein
MSKAQNVCLRVAVSLLTLGIAACAAKSSERPIKMGAVDTGPGTLSAARSYLEGKWNLVSYEFFPANQEPIRLQGAGTLTYDGYGRLNMEIRVDDATVKKLASAGVPSVKNVVSTSGYTVVDMQNRTLTYVAQGQSPIAPPQGPLGLYQPRYWDVNGNVLTLTTKTADGTTLSVGRWQKVP